MGNDLVGDGPRDQGDMKPEGAPGIDVELNHPTDVTFSPLDGSVLVAAWHNHKIRRLDPQTGRVTVLVGSGAGKTGDGAAAKAALLNQPKAVALDAAGNIFVADSRNHRIRRIDAATGFIATVAGNGMAGFAGDGGQPADRQLPHAIRDVHHRRGREGHLHQREPRARRRHHPGRPGQPLRRRHLQQPHPQD